MTTLLILTVLIGQPAAPPDAAAPGSLEARKEARDKLIVSLGEDSLAMTMEFGDPCIAALANCPAEVGRRLVAIHASGEWAQIKHPRAVLESIRVHGAPVAKWVADNHPELADAEKCEVFCRAPLEFVYRLQSLSAKASQLRASRKPPPPAAQANSGEWDSRCTIFVLIVLGLIVGAFWAGKRWKSSGGAIMHYPK